MQEVVELTEDVNLWKDGSVTLLKISYYISTRLVITYQQTIKSFATLLTSH